MASGEGSDTSATPDATVDVDTDVAVDADVDADVDVAVGADGDADGDRDGDRDAGDARTDDATDESADPAGGRGHTTGGGARDGDRLDLKGIVRQFAQPMLESLDARLREQVEAHADLVVSEKVDQAVADRLSTIDRAIADLSRSLEALDQRLAALERSTEPLD
jgi:hypothetical protein